MPERRPRLLPAVAALAAAAAVVVGVPAAAQPADDEPVDLGVYGAPLRFEAPDGVVMELGSGRRLVDTVEVRPSPVGDGVVVVAEMSLDTYVAGVAEMPARWPVEALKAQAVAARTYAWYQAERETYVGRGLPYDICATTACQVFRGHEVVETAVVGQRWQQAVDDTAGEVLLHDGSPILARYFSTSGGRTRNNEDVFPSSGAFPYLQGIEDPDDATSPLHRWQAVFTRSQFDDLLGRGQTLSAAVPIADAEVIPQGGGVPDRVVVTGQDGTTAEVTAGELKSFLNDVAPSNFPDDFPGPRRGDGKPLPSTVPSSRYTIEVTDDQVVLDGSGWGHGVGMGQYGARGKAERGMTYDQILSAYYTGVAREVNEAAPDRVRVGLADDIDELTVTADGGPLTVRAGDTVLTERGFGTWTLQAAADETTRLVAPAGYGAPLVAEATTTSRSRPYTVEVVALETVVNKPAELVVEVARDGQVVGRSRVGVVDRGRRTATWDLSTDDGPLDPGAYDVTLLAIDEDGTEAGSPVAVEVVEPTAAAAPASILAVRAPVAAEGVAATAPLLALAAGVLGGVLVRRRRPRRPVPA